MTAGVARAHWTNGHGRCQPRLLAIGTSSDIAFAMMRGNTVKRIPIRTIPTMPPLMLACRACGVAFTAVLLLSGAQQPPGGQAHNTGRSCLRGATPRRRISRHTPCEGYRWRCINSPVAGCAHGAAGSRDRSTHPRVTRPLSRLRRMPTGAPARRAGQEFGEEALTAVGRSESPWSARPPRCPPCPRSRR